MKKTILSIYMLFFLFTITKGQNDSSELKDFEKAKLKNTSVEDFLSQNIKFPISLIDQSVNANVSVSFLITKKGKIDSVKILNSPKKELAIEALSALDLTDNLWIPTKIDGQNVNWRYIASFSFVTTTKYQNQKKKIQKQIRKNDNENALDLINECLKFNEYDTELYQLRSSVYSKTSKPELSDKDLNKVKFLEQNLIVDLWITVIGIPRTSNIY